MAHQQVRPEMTQDRQRTHLFPCPVRAAAGTVLCVNSLSDQQLLRDYAGKRSEDAFTELVRRHVDLVYSAALRMVRDAHLAEDMYGSVPVVPR